MKTGRPEYSMPSESTVSRDVKKVFLKVRGRIAKILQVRIQVSYIITYDDKSNLLLSRNMTVPSALGPTRGRHLTTKHM
jgi:hypothetical protein